MSPSTKREDLGAARDLATDSTATETKNSTDDRSEAASNTTKRRRLISGMWVHNSSAINTQNMQEILFNSAMTKAQIADIRASSSRSNSNNNVEDMKHKDVGRTTYKIDPNVSTKRTVDIEGERVEVNETCYWEDLALTDTDPDTRKGTTALIILQKDEKHQREIITSRFVEKEGVNDEITAVDESGKPLSYSRIYTKLKVVRKEKDLRTGVVKESENTFQRRKK